MSPPPKPPTPPDAKPDDSAPEAVFPSVHITPDIIVERPTLTSLESGDSQPSGQKARSAFAGLVLDDFELLEEIGRGGMGAVFKARQKSLDRIVAIKSLLAHHFTHTPILQRFLGEARAAAGLSHPNIVKIYQVGECPAGHYFVMEYIEGRSLKDIIQERTAPISWTVALMSLVAEAIHHAHKQGIIHRDLKPSNIMIDSFRRPVVMDFGLAKWVDKPSTITQLGVIVGTPAYMSPEQAGEEIHEVRPASDIYSLGAILYTLLTGRPPFHEKTSLKTVMKVASAEMPPMPSEFRKDIPEKLEKICMKCLSKAAADRFPSAKALADELSQFRKDGKHKSSSMSLRKTMPSVLLIAEKTGKRLRLFNETNVIGRASECDIVIKASDVSKRHCQIILESDRVLIEDLNSVNGTLLNGEPIQLAELLDGDQLIIGEHAFHVRMKRRKR